MESKAITRQRPVNVLKGRGLASKPPASIGVAQRSAAGETESGDRFVVRMSDRRATIGVIDGLGHGPEAARAAEAAARVIEASAAKPPATVLERCHESLKQTRGAAITLLAYDGEAGALQWAGIGNVTASLFRLHRWGRLHRSDLLVRSGVVGMKMPNVRAMSLAVSPGDFLVVATDGLKPAHLDAVRHVLPPQALADRLLSAHHRDNDDALVLVARFQGRRR